MSVGRVLGVLALVVTMGCSADGGRGVRTMDAGTISLDEGTPSVTEPGDESGSTTGRACAESVDTLPPEALPRCAAETSTCLAACQDEACYDQCIANDPTPALMDAELGEVTCEDCINFNPIFCATNEVCATEWGTYGCCIDDCMAGGGTEDACFDSCGAEQTAFFTCFQNNAAACRDSYAACFGS